MPADRDPVAGADFIDATLFMAMHAKDDTLRAAAKSFFVERLAAGAAGRVVMSWEQVGRCDDLVWGYGRAEQDDYYPFMDVLHTDLAIDRIGYGEADARRAFTAPEWAGLPAHERLLLAQVVGHGGTLHTASSRLARLTGPSVATVVATAAPGPVEEPTFPAPLERLYQRSLVLRVGPEDL
ncbi:DUF6190 family protein [Streptomyces sp. DvalAA-19]|uniref:DUF6190 family protein n=1 Tax=Streptomyces sp. DvalAA-19 TaxID=1839761 RepID=UPI00081B5F7D|nr:DUF6190 family protein [Streptomyces sp. DvalAA-19]SCD96448.1 hypothetical protein GA0115244_114418 [Streptomyces sp. DvalAA-19]